MTGAGDAPRTAPGVFWEIVYEDDKQRRLELADVFLELRQREEDSDWVESQRSANARRAATARRARAAAARKSPAQLKVETQALAEWKSNPDLSVNRIAEILRKNRKKPSIATLRRWISPLKSR